MRAELEAIWNKSEIANACHITGWLDKLDTRLNKIGHYKSNRLSEVLVAIRGRRVMLKLINRKAAIFKHQRLG